LTTSKGVTLDVSDGPCTRFVESRSVLLLTEFAWMWRGVKLVGGVGVALLVLALFSVVLLRFCFSTHRSPDVAPVDHGPAEVDPKLLRQFDDAQRRAVRRLTDETPMDLKLQLYAFCRQAKDGNVRGERPGSWAKPEDQARWASWADLRGMPKDKAIHGYISVVNQL